MTVLEKRCYSQPFGETNWFAAEQTCREWGGHLFSFNTQGQYNVAKDVFPTRGFWLGMSKGSYGSPWTFSDGTNTDLALKMWAPGEPNGNGGVMPICSWSASWTNNVNIDDIGCYQVAAPFICTRVLDDSMKVESA
mmetsp:Transcript_85488/g.227981  ORF Transcript_85488/g.227981 Transcript_85488/m.227981 type:complete len:136 (-) Transcript_85488:47-454(-)